MTNDKQPEPGESALNPTPESAEHGNEESASEAATENVAQAAGIETDEDESETEDQPRPPARLERLQKILAQAGVASRRSAEQLITQGRIQVNGKIVTELGTKADAARDHIRVDGKLLHGAERLRYFILNKPRGFVTTVKDPEGRPTVMEFFAKMAERLYPVGRLDYLSEGLLLVTNDGELANKLTKAASGVEKTYLVKVSGQPTEDELQTLRGGVSIERGKAGEGRVRTAPARIRQVRQGDNPWYEVVLIEGRNRELRKMFEEIGHFVEKIRRVGYGPLVLDVEPGNLRELEPEELAALRLAAEGKLRTPKAKEVRRRNALDAQLPTLAPRPSMPRPVRPAEGSSTASGRTGDYRPKKSFGPPERAAKPFRPARPSGEEFRPAAGRSTERSPARGPSRPAWKKDDERPRRTGAGPAKFGPGRPTERTTSARPAWKKDERTARPSGRPPARPEWKKEPGQGRTFGARPAANKPAWSKPAAGSDRPAYKRPSAPRDNAPASTGGFAGPKPPRLRIEAVEPERPGTSGPASARPSYSRPSPSRPRFDRPGPGSDRPKFDRPRSDRPSPSRPGPDRSSPDRSSSGRPGTGRSGTERSGAGRSGPARPFRGEGGLARPFTTSSGKPRAGGARPSSKPGKPAGSRPAGQRTAGAGSAGKTGWKPRPQFGGPGKPASPGRAKPAFGSKPGGPAKSGYKGKPGGKRPGGAPGGRKHGRG